MHQPLARFSLFSFWVLVLSLMARWVNGTPFMLKETERFRYHDSDKLDPSSACISLSEFKSHIHVHVKFGYTDEQLVVLARMASQIPELFKRLEKATSGGILSRLMRWDATEANGAVTYETAGLTANPEHLIPMHDILVVERLRWLFFKAPTGAMRNRKTELQYLMAKLFVESQQFPLHFRLYLLDNPALLYGYGLAKDQLREEGRVSFAQGKNDFFSQLRLQPRVSSLMFTARDPSTQEVATVTIRETTPHDKSLVHTTEIQDPNFLNERNMDLPSSL